MRRLLVIPAAGRGTRLESDLPKVLHPVAGRPMVDHLLDLHAPYVDSALLVVAPDFEDEVRDHLSRSGRRADLAVQAVPTGMLPAILLAEEAVRARQPDRIWITWCDQVAIRESTLRRLARLEGEDPGAALAFPTCSRADPYIHFPRDAQGRISGVLHAREGDEMPEVGESDVGFFSLCRRTFLQDLASFPGDETGGSTGERNFLPFIPWLAGRGEAVLTFPVTDEMESVGVNTPGDLRRVERYLLER